MDARSSVPKELWMPSFEILDDFPLNLVSKSISNFIDLLILPKF